MPDVPELLISLKSVGRILSEFIHTIPDDRMHRRRGAGFWTLAEHLSHLAEVQPMLLERLERIYHEDTPVFVPFIPDGGNEASGASEPMPAAEALARFEDYRKKQVALLDRADRSTWEKTARHPEYDQYSLYILARHILMHDYWHMYRMEEIWLTKDAFLTRL